MFVLHKDAKKKALMYIFLRLVVLTTSRSGNFIYPDGRTNKSVNFLGRGRVGQTVKLRHVSITDAPS